MPNKHITVPVRLLVALGVILIIAAGVGFGRRAHAAAAIRSYGITVSGLTRTDPNNLVPTAAEKFNVYQVNKIRCHILSCTDNTCSTVGGNLTGGTVEIWCRADDVTSQFTFANPAPVWLPNPDLFLTVGSPGQPGRWWADIYSPGGNFPLICMARPNGVTTASGTGAYVMCEGIDNE